MILVFRQEELTYNLLHINSSNRLLSHLEHKLSLPRKAFPLEDKTHLYVTVLQNNERWCFLVLEFFFLWASFFAASFLATCAGWRTS